MLEIAAGSQDVSAKYNNNKEDELLEEKINKLWTSDDTAFRAYVSTSLVSYFCSAWPKPKLNTKIGLHTTTHHKELVDHLQATERIGVWYITIL